jgi:ATP dependent DNA ligase-like protein
VKNGPDVRLLSRKTKNLTRDYPTIAAGVAALKPHATVLDGEIVAVDQSGPAHRDGHTLFGVHGNPSGKCRHDCLLGIRIPPRDRWQSASRGLTNLGPGLDVAPAAEGRKEPIEISVARDEHETVFTAGRSQQGVICQ